MTSRFINGARYAVSTLLAAAIPITAVSNASPAVATTATPPVAGDILILNGGWPDLNDVAARAASPTANSFQIEGSDTTDLTRFPAGQGVGTYRKASAFIGMSQVRDVQLSGGDQNFFTYQYVEDPSSTQRQAPTFKTPLVIEVTLDYDPDLPWYQTLITLDRKRQQVVLRETLPAGDVIYYVGLLSFNKVPSKEINANMTVKATFSLSSDPIRFTA